MKEILIGAMALWALQSGPPKLRLGESVRPTRYTLDLTVVPTADTFSGSVDISLDVGRPTRVIWLHATDLMIQEVTLTDEGGSVRVRPVAGDKGFLGLSLDRPAGKGPARLHLSYEGRFSAGSSDGLFKLKEGNDWYVFSQFEATSARRAFPCFDEPAFKVPWKLTLRVKREHLALSNTPMVGETEEPNGMKAVRFAETKSLSSYHIGLAVGPFEIVEAGRAGKKKTPVRVVTLRGKSDEAGYAAQATPEILSLLEDYFGTAYPYEKLDSVAIPFFPAAMEHPGLITYGETFILSKPEAETISHKRNYADFCAHELAHQWFGNLVTMSWWDDTWLNEAFASWLATKIVDLWKPEWNVKLAELEAKDFAMRRDNLISARKIRQPIESESDIANAFDATTYWKGAAVIGTFEAWVGADTFRSGVRRYLTAHAWGNAAAADFLGAIAKAAGRDVATPFSSFLDQPGLPLVSVELECNPDPPKVALSQKRFLPLGSPGSPIQTWQIPICIRYGNGTKIERQCTLLEKPRAELPLDTGTSCPDWVVANDGDAGYYHVLYGGGLLARLLEDGGKRLTLPERMAALRDCGALVESGDMPAADALALARELGKDPNRYVVSATLGVVAGLDRYDLVPAELQPNYARFVRRTYGERARQLGWIPKAGEDADTRLLRRDLVRFVASEGDDKTLIDEAAGLARRWVDDRRAIDPEMVEAVLWVAAQNGDRALFDRFRAGLKETKDRKEREQLLAAMGAFRNPDAAEAAFALLLTTELDFRESAPLLFGPLLRRETRSLPYRFVKRNYNALVARMPRGVLGGNDDPGAILPFVARRLCSEDDRADVEAFFKDRALKLTGAPRILAQSLESIRLCSAVRDAQRASAAAFLKAY